MSTDQGRQRTGSKWRPLLSRFPYARRAVLAARFGHPGRVAPLSDWGDRRGLAVDRWYIESYLERHSEAIHGRVLEVKEDLYGSRLGAFAVDVVDINPANVKAQLLGDLCDPDTLPSKQYDAAIITQTLQYLSAPEQGLRNVLGSLRPGGALLLTVPCLGRVHGYDDRWRWTPPGLEQQLRSALGATAADVQVLGLGNGLAARAFLFGLAADDLVPAALEQADPELPLVVGAYVRLLC